MERSNLSPGQRGRCPAKPFLLEAGISQTVPAWCRGVGLLVWTIWPGFYIPQDFSITGLGGVERPSGQHFLVLISPEARSLQLSSKYFQVSQHHLKWAVLHCAGGIWGRTLFCCAGLSFDLQDIYPSWSLPLNVSRVLTSHQDDQKCPTLCWTPIPRVTVPVPI